MALEIKSKIIAKNIASKEEKNIWYAWSEFYNHVEKGLELVVAVPDLSMRKTAISFETYGDDEILITNQSACEFVGKLMLIQELLSILKNFRKIPDDAKEMSHRFEYYTRRNLERDIEFREYKDK